MEFNIRFRIKHIHYQRERDRQKAAVSVGQLEVWLTYFYLSMLIRARITITEAISTVIKTVTLRIIISGISIIIIMIINTVESFLKAHRRKEGLLSIETQERE